MADKTIYEEITSLAQAGDTAGRLKAAAIILDQCGDDEMAEALNTLSAQLDFDDNAEANEAITRTRARINKLIKDRNAVHAQSYIKLMTDDDIREISSGQVTEGDYDLLTSSYVKRGLFDPDIFGGSGKIPLCDDEKFYQENFGTAFGHIELPVRVLLDDMCDEASSLLKITSENIRKVTHYACYMVIEPGKTDLRPGSVLKEKEFEKYKDAKGFKAMIGADAVYELLIKLNRPDHPERIAFKTILVTSPKTRPIGYHDTKAFFYTHPLAQAYDGVITAVNRYEKLRELGAPDIITRNEAHMLCESVETLFKYLNKYALHIVQSKSKKSSKKFTLQQIHMALRNHDFSFVKTECPKTSEIQSLNLYPEMITLVKNNKTSKILLSEVIDQCMLAKQNFYQENAVIIQDGREATPEEQEEIDRVDSVYNQMDDAQYAILDGAHEQREEFKIVYDTNLGMYMPA